MATVILTSQIRMTMAMDIQMLLKLQMELILRMRILDQHLVQTQEGQEDIMHVIMQERLHEDPFSVLRQEIALRFMYMQDLLSLQHLKQQF